MGLRFDPMGGGKFAGVVKDLVEMERQPIKNMEQRKAIEVAKQKTFSELKNSVASLQASIDAISNFKKLIEYKVDLGDGVDLMDVSVDKDRVKPGSYEIQIDEVAHRGALISNGLADPKATDLGAGAIRATRRDGEKFELSIDGKNNSLYGIAQQINDAPNSPLQASVVKDDYNPDKPWRLIINSKNAGEENGWTVGDLYFVGGRQRLWAEEDRDPKNAYLKLNGFQIDSPGNEVPDFLEGVNVKLKGARPDKPFTLTIAKDTPKIVGKVETMVNDVNKVLKFINDQNKVDENTNTKDKFTGDTGLQTIEHRLRNLLHEGFWVPNTNGDGYRLVWLNQMGVEFEKTGTLKFSKDKFQAMLDKDFEGVSEAISGSGGFAQQLKSVLNGFTSPGTGVLSLRESAMRDRIRRIDDQIDQVERRVESKQRMLTDKFARLEGTLSQLQSQQQYMAAQLGAGGGNVISQLLG